MPGEVTQKRHLTRHHAVEGFASTLTGLDAQFHQRAGSAGCNQMWAWRCPWSGTLMVVSNQHYVDDGRNLGQFRRRPDAP